MSDAPDALPIVCTLAPGELSRRTSELLPGLLRRARGRQAIAGGYRLAFDGEVTIGEIARVIETERTCCQFLRFQLTIEPGLGAVHLDVTGPAGTADFLESLLQA
jgi:hypothetical protein